MATDKKITYEDQRLTKDQQKKIKPANQGGGPNYLGKQETVTVPKKWLSDPDHVVAELAYITPKEQKILLDANIYGSLKGKPNKGPGGIMSLQGDLGGYDASPGGPNSGGGGGNRVGQGDKNKQRVQDILRGNVTTGQTVAVSDKTRRGAVPEYVGDNYVGSAYKSYGQPSFLGDLFSGAPSGYRSTYGTQPGFFGNLLGRGNSISTIGTPGMPGFGYVSSDPRVGQIKPGIGGRFLGGIASLLTGVPLIGSAIGSAIDYGKGIFSPKDYVGYDDMSDFNRLTIGGVKPVQTFEFNPSKFNTRNVETVNSFDDIQGQVADASTTPTFDERGISLINRVKLKNVGFNDSQINEAFEGGYLDDIIRSIEPPLGGSMIG